MLRNKRPVRNRNKDAKSIKSGLDNGDETLFMVIDVRRRQ